MEHVTNYFAGLLPQFYSIFVIKHQTLGHKLPTKHQFYQQNTCALIHLSLRT